MSAILSYATLTEEALVRVNRELAQKDTLDVIKWAYSQW